MATITNTHNLPAAIVDAVTRDTYSRGNSDISVSQLVAPPRQVALKERHADEVVEDVSERIYALLGRAVHEVLEQGGHDALKEERLYCVVCPEHGVNPVRWTEEACCGQDWRISGQFDSLSLSEEGGGWHLWDWKVCSIWTAKDGPKPEWEAQLNLYALLLREHGFNVTDASIGAIYRDWSKRKAQYEADYPPVGAAEVPVRVWSQEEQEAYLFERLRAHAAARVELPECTEEERWAKPTQWAVMKQGRKTALRLMDTENRAYAWAAHNGFGTVEGDTKTDEEITVYLHSGVTVEKRPGENVRCDLYCNVADFCDQYKALKGEA